MGSSKEHLWGSVSCVTLEEVEERDMVVVLQCTL